jgi:protocatechuate 3,4-dioxygenase beta subunit
MDKGTLHEAHNGIMAYSVELLHSGIAMTLQLTVQDASSCQPFSNAMVEVWSRESNDWISNDFICADFWEANAQGDYGDFLRGAFQTASDGTVSFQTIFPGFSDGANHVSIAVHQSDEDSPMVYTGKLFFTDRRTDVVSMQPAYTGNEHTRVLNAADPDYQAANNGFNAVLKWERKIHVGAELPLTQNCFRSVLSIHDDWPEGVTADIGMCWSMFPQTFDLIAVCSVVGVNPENVLWKNQWWKAKR